MADHPPFPPRPGLWRNPISFLGLGIAVLSTVVGLPLLFLDMASPHTNPYLGSVIYLILPVAAAAGVAVAGAGALIERALRRRDPGRAARPLPVIDFNRPAHRLALLAAFAAVAVLTILLSVTGYRAYHFTESVEFCGLTCHKVMKPEYVAYQHSPHARVACVECHVGSGAESYVKAKLNGLRQVVSIARGTYPRPIPTPVHSLRPAPETCEQCHWPAKFFGAQQKTFTHYLADEANSPWQIQLLIKVGGGNPASGAEGIHWHMNIQNQIEYIAADERRERIPWVRVTAPDGQVTEYLSTEEPLTPAQVAAAAPRRMDCVDCHNRPTHIFRPPNAAIDEAIALGRVDGALPFVKREGIKLLAAEYASEAEALAAIEAGLAAFYEREYPEVFRTRADAVRQAGETLKQLYAANLFPEMKADWRAHPNHAGHLNSDGCFRCHDGLHRSVSGKVITNDCNACHTILAQGPPASLAGIPLQAQAFQHPVDVGMDVSGLKCSECHTGTSGL